MTTCNRCKGEGFLNLEQLPLKKGLTVFIY